ncbi:MAG: hypothetical protein OXN90_16640, partial [Gemmatimonadota bacterium]|nr:hypothetical protein [Gemmatimonadota bacterium]
LVAQAIRPRKRVLKRLLSERWDTHEVIDKISVEAENAGKASKDKINSNGDIITVKFELFERFFKDLMKNYKEDSYVEWLTEFYEKRPIYSTDRINDVLYIYCQYDTKKRDRYSRIRVVKIYTEKPFYVQ